MAMRSLRAHSQATPGLRFSILGAVTGKRTLSGENLNNLAPVVETKEYSLDAEKRKKRAVVVNSKWGERSVDPLYSHLLYSSEVDVVNTVRRGKAWMEARAAEQFRAENDRKVRERNAMKEPTPIALSFLYGGAKKVQGEADVTKNQEILITEQMEAIEAGEIVKEELEGGDVYQDHVNPYSVYTPLQDTAPAIEERKGRRKRKGHRAKIIETEKDGVADHDVIQDSLHTDGVRQHFSEDHLYKHGTADLSHPGTGVPCSGCGATLHCREERIPGFVPSQILQGLTAEELRVQPCQRCYIIQEYNVALKVNVSPEDYPKAIEHIKDKEALVLLVVDLLDFPGSVWPGILSLLGTNKRVIIVGNKLDLIVPDGQKYVKRITNIIRRDFMQKCFVDGDGEGKDGAFPQIVAACCVSASTGLNVEKLVEIIFDHWKNKQDSLPGDIYLVGCTNVGKSTLFNSLLESDLCKVAALDKVKKAVTSPVPGTTLNLLKFPLSRPEPHFLRARRNRLRKADQEFWRREDCRIELLKSQPKLQHSIPSHYAIKHTLLDSKTEVESSYMNIIDTSEHSKRQEVIDPMSAEYTMSKFCYDSPGTVSQDQIINLLSSEEITKTLANTPLHPRTFLLKLDQTILLGGIARLDYIDGPEKRATHPLLVTIFCSASLPVNILTTPNVDAFLERAQGSPLLLVGAEGRQTPPLLGRKIEVEGVIRRGTDWWSGAKDIVLSSCGWVMVSSSNPEEVSTFLAYTPGGRGIAARDPFLPDSVQMRGKRVQGTISYRSDFFQRSLWKSY